jgi:hypothetical protein
LKFLLTLNSAGLPNLFVAIVILPIVNSFLFLFAGVLNPSSSLPYFWRVRRAEESGEAREVRLTVFIELDVPVRSVPLFYGRYSQYRPSTSQGGMR